MRFRRILFSAITSFALILTIFNTRLNAVFVFLKDGAIVEGDILADSANSVTLSTKEKKQKQIPRDKVLRIIYTKLNMAKIFIQKRDGSSVVAYIVDEEEESYTFRKELYKPEEFVLNSEDILFMAEKNPSGLKVSGKVGIDRVSLTWLPPYDEVKKYNIYMKKEKSGKYDLIESTKSKSITLKNLSGKTTYFLIVTSVDNTDYESSPSNELKITTKSNRPEKPVVTSSGDLKADDKEIKWNPSSDLDGKVEKYRIYAIKDDKREMIAETDKTEYILKNSLNYNRAEIAAVDDDGNESNPSKIKFIFNTFLQFSPEVIVPLGKFGKMYNMGYGGTITLSQRNLFFKNFECGITSGFYFMEGNDLLDTINKDYHTLMFAPLYLTAGFNIRIGGSFTIKPGLSVGGAFIDAKYFDRNKITEGQQNVHLKTIEPVCKADLSAGYILTDHLSISVGSGYGLLIEKSSFLSFLVLNTGISYSF